MSLFVFCFHSTGHRTWDFSSSRTADAMAAPSKVEVPRPSSSCKLLISRISTCQHTRHVKSYQHTRRTGTVQVQNGQGSWCAMCQEGSGLLNHMFLQSAVSEQLICTGCTNESSSSSVSNLSKSEDNFSLQVPRYPSEVLPSCASCSQEACSCPPILRRRHRCG